MYYVPTTWSQESKIKAKTYISMYVQKLSKKCPFKVSIHTQFPSAIGWRKKSYSSNHKTTIWVSHEYYLNPEFQKIPARTFWVIVSLGFSPYVARVDFKGLISK